LNECFTIQAISTSDSSDWAVHGSSVTQSMTVAHSSPHLAGTSPHGVSPHVRPSPVLAGPAGNTHIPHRFKDSDYGIRKLSGEFAPSSAKSSSCGPPGPRPDWKETKIKGSLVGHNAKSEAADVSVAWRVP
jgi:hypothetical protein